MSKAKQADLLDFYKERCETYEDILSYVRAKCRGNGDMEYALRSQIRRFARERAKPLPGTPEYREAHGIPID